MKKRLGVVLVLKKNPYKFTVLSMYVNYILQGMAAIILSQNLASLVEQMDTTVPRFFTFVITAIGLGRIVSLPIAGWISDKYNRKLVIVLGMASYFLFFGGILFSNNLYLGIFFALFAGVANALLDTGTYPALLEAMPELFDSTSVLIRAFISVGQFILPLIVGFTIANELYFGISFLFCLAILMINMVVMLKFVPFPPKNNDLREHKGDVVPAIKPPISHYLAGACLLLFGFTAVSTFNIFVNWIPHVAETVIGMSAEAAVRVVSVYSLFSFISVITTSILVKKWIKPMYLVLGYTTGACLTLVALAYFPSLLTAYLAAFGVGFFATGGIWQLGLATLLELFSANKGKITSYYSFLTSLGIMLMPFITGQLQPENIMQFATAISLAGILLSLIIIVCIRERANLIDTSVSN